MSEEHSESDESVESGASGKSGKSGKSAKSVSKPDSASKGDDPPAPPRSARQVRSAAKILHREASKILRRHADRIAAEPAEQMRECVESIERLRDSDDVAELETVAETLDELLEQHASFARKSALRETLENIGIAVFIALGLRSCLYEPFKIPSGSMMPTLRTGDHIFVNKFIYGIQVPFTTTVVGESLGEIKRGEVIVFRFPLDESQDFIKRVIGLPGDEVRVAGRRVEVRRAGDEDFTVLTHERLEQRCFDNEGQKPIANCTLYEENNGDTTYVVRYRLTTEERGELAPPPQVWKVPEGHLMVMGDNRNDSLDSRRWMVEVEAVKADGLLSTKDLRDLTDERLFTMSRPETIDEQGEFAHDHVVFQASHRALPSDLGLEAWREPTLGAESIEAAKVGALAGARAIGWEALVGPGEGAELDALRQQGESIESLHVAEDPDGRQAVLRLDTPAAVLSLSCGIQVCPDEVSLAKKVAEVLERFNDNRDRESRELLARPKGPTHYTSQFKSRNSPGDHYHQRRFASAEVTGRKGEVRLRAFRRPDDGTELVRDAALHSYGVDLSAEDAPKTETNEKGLESWLFDDGEAWVSIGVDRAREMVVILECGKGVCTKEDRVREMIRAVHERVPRAAGDRRRLARLLGKADVEGLPEVPGGRLELSEYDRVRLEATVRDEAHSVELEAWLRPEEGLSAKVEALTQEIGGMEADDAALAGAYSKAEEDAIALVLPVPESETVILLRCHRGLCPTRETAVALARRAANRAEDPDNFIDPEAERPQPFVPRGNVKGRAERIWLPFSRFWLPIR